MAGSRFRTNKFDLSKPMELDVFGNHHVKTNWVLLAMTGYSHSSAVVTIHLKDGESIELRPNTFLSMPDLQSEYTVTCDAQPGVDVGITAFPPGHNYEPGVNVMDMSGRTIISTGDAFTMSEPAVNTAASPIVPLDPKRTKATIYNYSSNTIYLGTEGVTVGHGIRLSPGASFEWTLPSELHAISSVAIPANEGRCVVHVETEV